MDLRSEVSARHALQIWQSRQNCDGCLVAVLAIATAVPALAFACAPAIGTACVLAVFLLALGLACVRLLDSAAMAVRIRDSFGLTPTPEIIEAEILDVYEHPGALNPPTIQTPSALWVAAPNHESVSSPRTDFLYQAPLPSSALLYRARRYPAR